MTASQGRLYTFRLIPKAEAALREAVEVTESRHADVVNRALQVYAYVEKERAVGRELLIRDGDQVSTLGWDKS